jgi:hypothetical protein
MPKLIHPDTGEATFVSHKGAAVLRDRGYLDAEDVAAAAANAPADEQPVEEESPAPEQPADEPTSEDPADKPAADVPARPDDGAPKGEWVAYAEGRGVSTDGLTKADLIAATA